MGSAGTPPNDHEDARTVVQWGGLAAGQIAPDLADVSETMLWALHNRATEAGRRDGILVDPDSVRIRNAIDYDFAGRFGDPIGSLAVRAAEIDRALRRWLERHPDGFVVSLGEGLETQVRRVDNGCVRWLSVDLPKAIRLRERFLAPTERFRHIGVSALDVTWMDAVDPSSGVFIVAQGLLMYLESEAVRRLYSCIADRFPGAEMVFDVVPRWFSRLTLLGLNQTPQYRLPPMPWGINRDELEPTLRRWHPGLNDVEFLDYHAPRGLPLFLAHVLDHIPVVRHEVPSLVHATLATTVGRPAMISNPVVLRSIAPARSFKERRRRRKDKTEPRKPQMTSVNSGVPDAGTIGDVFAVATRNACRGGDLVIATSQVMAKRVAIGIAGALNPLRADHMEFARIVPEKVEAFSTAGMIMLQQSHRANRQMTRLASDEVATTARATIAMAGCSSPAGLAVAQSRFALAWYDRAASTIIAMGLLALRAQDAAMAPLRHTVTANAERLGR
jgi:O-methyltransferase involved in polyketide biosynthesis